MAKMSKAAIPSIDWRSCARCVSRASKANGFTDLRNLLEKEATVFQKPVVLVNGDSHYFRIDNPYRKNAPSGQRPPPSLENFLRVETFGTPNHHWLHVTVDSNDPNVF